MNVELPATVRQCAEASGWSEQSIRRFARRGFLRIDETKRPALIVGGELPDRRAVEPVRCPFTLDMFEAAE